MDERIATEVEVQKYDEYLKAGGDVNSLDPLFRMDVAMAKARKRLEWIAGLPVSEIAGPPIDFRDLWIEANLSRWVDDVPEDFEGCDL